MSVYPAVFESYETKRAQLAVWAQTHYVDEFDLKPGRLLEAGCGEGFWADVFTALGFTASGFDIEPAYIDAGRDKYPRVDLQIADALGHLPYEQSFDVVFVRAMSCFYSYRLAKMRRVLTNLLPLVGSDGLLLVSAYSDGSGEKRPGAHGGEFWHHPHDAYLKAAADVGTIIHTAAKGNYLQIGIK